MDDEKIFLSNKEEILINILRLIKKYWKYELCFVFGMLIGIIL